MDVKYLTYIVTIAKEKNMTKAAEKLFVSQSSLSYYLTKLEADIGTPLFYRKKNGLFPTPVGQLYLEAAQKVIQIKEKLYKDIYNMDNKAHIILSTTSLWGTRMFAEIVPRFKTEFPEVTFELSQFEIIVLQNDITNDTIDFALLSLASLDGMEDSIEVLRKEELFFAVPKSHPYVLSHPGDTITQQDMVDNFYSDIFLLSRKGSANRILADEIFAKYRNTPPPHISEVNGLPLTCDMVASEVGVAFMPLSGRSREDMIHYYSLSPKLYRYNVLFHRKNAIYNEPEQAFVDWVKDYFR